MGCFWSNEERDYCIQCNRRGVNELVIIDHICEICINKATSTSYVRTYIPPGSTIAHVPKSPAGPKYGEYRCSKCRRYWSSRWCWPNKYQMCKQCKTPTLPYNYRDLTPSDVSDSTDHEKEHVRELCQMCQQLGYPCKDFGKKYKPQTARNIRTPGKSSKTHRKSFNTQFKRW